jgi:hypothetical protein
VSPTWERWRRKRWLWFVRREFLLQLPSRKRIPQGPCLPRLPVRNNLRPRPSHSRRKRRRSRSRLPTRDLSTLNCRIHAIPLRGICPALCRNSTCKTRQRLQNLMSGTASSTSPCRTRSLWPSKIISCSPPSATTSPSRKPIFCAPRREASQRRQHQHHPDHAERLWRLRGRRWLRSSRCDRRRRRHRHLHARRRRGRSLVRPLPQLQRLCATHRHPGAERYPGRRRTL